MRFVDANVFVYAVLKPKRSLSESERAIKTNSSNIVNRIDKGEEVITSVVHLSEVANILEDVSSQRIAADFMINVLSKPNLEVVLVDKNMYTAASFLAKEKLVGVNDALAALIMKDQGISEIYSFDKHLDDLGVKRIAE
ncbi:MAG: type II toxin-antitoxin system VapC family toxin [Methanocellales archaeon]|nr:type II toxin-antitoxin system VapC family toxin [Methanocellales archaeon]